MPLSWNDIRTNAIAFVKEWENETSEDAEAKSFWDAFFQIFGMNRRRFASFEVNVKKVNGAHGFIDLFWPGVLLAEHKSKGKDLDSAYGQAMDYFPGLNDKELPRYIIVSDFARIRLIDLEKKTNVEFPIGELTSKIELFGFIAGYETRTFKEEDPVNVKATEKLAELHDALRDIGYEGHELEVYLVRILFCLFADDTGIFMPRSAFEDFIRDKTSEDGSDLAPRLHQLFQVLNTPKEKRLKNLDEQIVAFPYVNGRLFEENLSQANFDRKMRNMLLECCELDWGQISPAIFGSLFQGIMDETLRHDLGAHYTSEKNILKALGPLFLDELKDEFQKVEKDTAKLKAFHEKLGKLNFFDPACGCGNFLVISYRELRLLELEVIKKLYGKEQQQLSLNAVDQYVKVNVDQFHGIEIEEWPSQIARVAMWLIDHQMNIAVGKSFGQTVVRIPLTKSANIVNDNALRVDWNTVLPRETCSYVVGNPPFLGKQYQSDAQKADLSFVFQNAKGSKELDFVCAWYLKTARYITEQTKCAFVSTNSITQGEQVGLLWTHLKPHGIHINFAHRTFRWRNESKKNAAVHCVIIGFSKKETKNPSLYDYATVMSDAQLVKASNINPYLVDGADMWLSSRRSPICDVPPIVFGSMANDDGWLTLTTDEKNDLLAKEPLAKPYIKKFLGATEFLNNKERWAIWLENATPGVLKTLPLVNQRVEKVKEYRLKSERKATRELATIPSLFAERRQPSTEYILVPRHSSERRSYIPMGFMTPDVICGDANLLIPNATVYHFGILSSSMHMAWVSSVCGRLESRYRYTNEIVYNNFPWPTKVKEKDKKAIEEKAQAVLDARAKFPSSSLSDMYDPNGMPIELVKAHNELNRAVDKAYQESGGKKTWATDGERVSFLFKLYEEMTSLLPSEEEVKKAKRLAKKKAKEDAKNEEAPQ